MTIVQPHRRRPVPGQGLRLVRQRVGLLQPSGGPRAHRGAYRGDALPTIDRWGSLKGKRVLVRVDFNAPVAEIDGVLTVTDDFRLRAAVPLFEALLERGATVVACTHFGRPEGRVDERFSVAPLRRALAPLCPEVELLENLRFQPGRGGERPDFGARSSRALTTTSTRPSARRTAPTPRSWCPRRCYRAPRDRTSSARSPRSSRCWTRLMRPFVADHRRRQGEGQARRS